MDASERKGARIMRENNKPRRIDVALIHSDALAYSLTVADVRVARMHMMCVYGVRSRSYHRRIVDYNPSDELLYGVVRCGWVAQLLLFTPIYGGT